MAFARVGDDSIYYEIHGAGAGLPVVLIMGLGTNAHGWERQVPVLGAARRVLTLDNRGVGRSSKPPGPYTTDQLADDVDAILADAGLPRAHVVGISLGGAIAQKVALRHPRRVKSLVIIASFARADTGLTRTADAGVAVVVVDQQVWAAPTPPDRQSRIGAPRDDSVVDPKKRRRGADLAAMLAALQGPGAKGVDPRAVYGFLMPLVFSPEFLEREKETLRRLYETELAYGFAVHGLAGQVAAALGHDTVDRLATIGAPTLVVTGTRDRLVAPRLSVALAEGIHGARLVELEGGTHGLNLERADDLNALLVDWLAAHD